MHLYYWQMCVPFQDQMAFSNDLFLKVTEYYEFWLLYPYLLRNQLGINKVVNEISCFKHSKMWGCNLAIEPWIWTDWYNFYVGDMAH